MSFPSIVSATNVLPDLANACSDGVSVKAYLTTRAHEAATAIASPEYQIFLREARQLGLIVTSHDVENGLWLFVTLEQATRH